ncbi:MAG: VCBS repeat-containing protein [Donghicola eburneus]|nr:VCBS repeat-containing protein [Donghicola eburneus]MCI5039948.1 VCBS repeat-containing protein [Donghicola eburneus]
MLRSVTLALALGASPALAETITWAGYDGPTTRYDHEVLGDPVEYTKLIVRTDEDREFSLEWAKQIVFEDTEPLIVDLDNDGSAELLTVESHEELGSRLAIYGISTGTLSMLIATPFIGRKHRWLAKIGAEDLDGDGNMEIAYIDRPHLDKTLRIYRYTRIEHSKTESTVRLTPIADEDGLTNHQIGWPYIVGGIRTCEGDGTPEIITANGDWSQVIATTLVDGELKSRRLAKYEDPQTIQSALSCAP